MKRFHLNRPLNPKSNSCLDVALDRSGATAAQTRSAAMPEGRTRNIWTAAFSVKWDHPATRR